MKNIFIRALSLALAVLMLAALLVACAQDTDPDDKNPGETPNPGTPGEPDEEDPNAAYQIPDSLPAADFGGKEFSIFHWNDNQAAFYYVADKTGDLIDDAVWTSRAAVQDRFNVEIVALKSGAESEQAYTTLVTNQLTAGTPEFDVANMHDVQGGNLSIQGLFLNILDIEQFDFDKPWWSKDAIESMSFMGQLYLISSEISYNGMGSTQSVFFNKQMMDDRGMEYPYQKVLDKEWYLADMLESVEDLHEDINDNGKDVEDTFGILMPQEMYAIFESYGINMIEKNATGDELILNANDERIYDLVDYYYNIRYERDGGYTDVRNTTADMFKNSQGIYLTISMNYALTHFRDATFAYGIVPYPMLDEAQGDYHSGYTDRFMAIPHTCTDVNYVGTIIEAMSAEGYRQVLPAYYETALKGRYTHDSESVQMLEIIRKSRVIDFAYIYSNDTACTRALYSLLKDQKKDYASFYGEKESAATQRIEDLETKFAEMAY